MKQIDTPEFKRWFGNSKVVDAKGLPLVVYHGTNKSFTTFQTNRPMWFAVNPELASQFSAGGRRLFGSKPVKGSLIMPVFLRITNPLDLTYAHRWVRLSRVELMKEIGVDTSEESLRELAKRQLASGYVGVGSQIQDPVSYLVGVYQEKDSIYHLLDDPDMVLAMKIKGYDGLMMTESITTGTRSKPILIKSVTYAVFDATQVKSAYGNRGTFDPNDPDIRNPKLKPDSIYTDPAMRERLKRKIMAGDRGGRPGQWSARKAQLLAAEYEKAGGGYTGGRSKAQRSLSRWTKQDWRTKSGKPSLETGERYLPAAAIGALSSAEYAASTRAKRSATGQFSRQPKRIAMKTREFRNPATPDDLPPAAGAMAKSPQIDTPAFKRWFNGSIVVTRSGKPRIMYHGTGWTNLSEFRSFRSRSQIAGHFAFDPQFAEEFAMQYATASLDDYDSEEQRKYPSIYPVYLSLKKVFDIRKKGDRDAIKFDDIVDRDGLVEGPNGWSWDTLERYEIVRRMRSAGFDGFIDFEKGSNLEPTGIAVFDTRNVKSAYGNRGTFDPTDPDITNPMDPRSAKTQIATTVDTYRKASKMLGGKVIDYGAGLGLGTDALRKEGLLADSFEPYPERWQGKRPPTYTDSAEIPSASYDSLVSFSVINVVEPDVRKFLFQEVARILRPDGVALITGRTRQDVGSAKIKRPHLEDGGYLVGEDQRYQKGFTQEELERYANQVLGSGFTVEANRALNGASIKVTKACKAKSNPVVNNPKTSMVRSKLSRIIEPGDRILCYDTARGEDFYRLWDIIHTAMPLTKEALVEVEGMLDDDGVFVIESGEEPPGLRDHFRKATRYQGLLLVQGPMNPEEARINTEKLRRELE